jgi:hypothetical protein
MGTPMSPWDLYRQVLHHLHGGRLTMELRDGDTIRFEWWPREYAWLSYDMTLRDFQRSQWGAGQQIAEFLYKKWKDG